MKHFVCLLSDNKDTQNLVAPLLSRCGVTLHVASSVEACATAAQSQEPLCILIDLPCDEGIAVLSSLRRMKIRSPAILILDSANASVESIAGAPLDVLKRPVDLRILLSWIECMCAAHAVLANWQAHRTNRAPVSIAA